jgi:hypothetical protein
MDGGQWARMELGGVGWGWMGLDDEEGGCRLLVFKDPGHRTEKNNRNRTEQDRLGPDQWSIYGPVFCSPVAGLSFFKILWLQKDRFKSVATG